MIFLAFIIIPIIEISIFITIGSNIGILNTIAIILTTALVGIFLVRRQGIKLLFDAQRNLSQGVMPTEEIKGGIFLYPQTAKNPNGKLRLLYECNPIAFICEQAGGLAINGEKNILDIEPKELHERTPFYCGSEKMIQQFQKFI